MPPPRMILRLLPLVPLLLGILSAAKETFDREGGAVAGASAAVAVVDKEDGRNLGGEGSAATALSKTSRAWFSRQAAAATLAAAAAAAMSCGSRSSWRRWAARAAAAAAAAAEAAAAEEEEGAAAVSSPRAAPAAAASVSARPPPSPSPFTSPPEERAIASSFASRARGGAPLPIAAAVCVPELAVAAPAVPAPKHETPAVSAWLPTETLSASLQRAEASSSGRESSRTCVWEVFFWLRKMLI